MDTDNSGSELVTLNGSGSTDSDGNIVIYVWSEQGNQIATGVNPSVLLTVGTHIISLTVTDNDGLTDTDTVTITIIQENPSEYPTLYEILGGSAPTIAESGRDFVTLTSPDANLVAFILLESAGFANENVFGIYSAYDPQQKLQLFSGSDSPTDTTIVQFNATDGNAENLQTGQTAKIGKFFGFYLTTPQNGGITYYTDLTRNPDSSEHGLIFNTSGFAGVIENDPDTVIAFEDFLGLGDRDYNDMVVGIINAVPLPGSGPYCIRDIPGDLNHDCKVDSEDFAIMASHWLECNLDPQSACR
jgi:PKD repeat protein